MGITLEGHHLAHYTPQNYKIRVQTWKSVSPREGSQGGGPRESLPTAPLQLSVHRGTASQLDRQVGITCALSPGDPGCRSGHDFRRAARGGPSATLRGLRTAVGPLWESPMILQAGFHLHPPGPGWLVPPHTCEGEGKRKGEGRPGLCGAWQGCLQRGAGLVIAFPGQMGLHRPERVLRGA